MTDISHILKKSRPLLLAEGEKTLARIDKRDAESMIGYAIARLQIETEIGLGIVSAPDGTINTPMFDLIDDIYRDAASKRNCYFCSGTEIDPNTEEVSGETTVCPHCLLKLANYTKFMGIDPKLVLPKVGERAVQKTVLSIEEIPPDKLN